MTEPLALTVPRASRLPMALLIGGAMVLIVLAVALLSLVWTPGDALTVVVSDRFQPPSAAHWLGTDRLGRDVASMIMIGARNSLSVALIAVAIGIAVGVPLGLAAASTGDWRDAVIMRATDLAFAFPALLMAIM